MWSLGAPEIVKHVAWYDIMSSEAGPLGINYFYSCISSCRLLHEASPTGSATQRHSGQSPSELTTAWRSKLVSIGKWGTITNRFGLVKASVFNRLNSNIVFFFFIMFATICANLKKVDMYLRITNRFCSLSHLIINRLKPNCNRLVPKICTISLAHNNKFQQTLRLLYWSQEKNRFFLTISLFVNWLKGKSAGSAPLS